jgi:hypothetical protein
VFFSEPLRFICIEAAPDFSFRTSCPERTRLARIEGYLPADEARTAQNPDNTGWRKIPAASDALPHHRLPEQP